MEVLSNLSLSQVSERLGVSEATIRNWVRLKVIEASNTSPILVNSAEVEKIQQQIQMGDLNKLSKRANKLHSLEQKSNISHLSDKATQEAAQKIIEVLRELDLSLKEKLMQVFVLILKSDFPQFSSLKKYTKNVFNDLDETCVEEIQAWFKFSGVEEVELKSELVNFDLDPLHVDLLGVIYQGLLTEGAKSKLGSFYTPSKIVIDALKSLGDQGGKFLDPCCGTGQFLLHAQRTYNLDFGNIYGFDIDPIAINISRFNLIRQNNYRNTKLNIFVMDSIVDLADGTLNNHTNDLIGKFDVIATNPPYGAFSGNRAAISQQYLSTSGEMFSYFIEKCIKLSKKSARLAFILPESFLKVATHKDIRKIILDKCSLDLITELGRPFPGVMSKIVQVNLINDTNGKQVRVLLENKTHPIFVKKSNFKLSPNLIFEYTNSELDNILLKKIYSAPHEKIGSKSEWGLGIVTGNNSAFIKDSEFKNWRPVLTGKELKPYSILPEKKWLDFRPESFQQYPNNNIFERPEKLFYKFVSKSLVFSYDDKQRISLNSANVLIPNLDHMSIKASLAFLNSKVFKYIFKKKFGTFKILKGNLLELPFPILSKEKAMEIEKLVDLIIKRDEAGFSKIEALIYEAFSLSASEVSQIESELNS
jgi:type I restriction-modification system DNA methylase subunit